MRRNLLFVVIILLLSTKILASTPIKIGSQAPSLKLPNLMGKTIELKDYYGQKPVILCFFASWSKPSQAEILFLQKLRNSYKQKDLEVLAISFDRKVDELKSFVKKNNLSLPILVDKNLSSLKEFRILIIPTLFLFDQEGKISNIYLDFDKNVEKSVEQQLKKLL